MQTIQAIAVTLLVLTATAPARSQDESPAATLALEDCRIRAGDGYPGIKARCGTFERPENPADPDSPVLQLAVAVVPALNLEPATDPFVPIAGGPGQSSIEFYAGTAIAFEAVRRNRDVVLIDQRGTGQSAPLRCDGDPELIEGRFSRDQTIADAQACLAMLQHDPRYFTTSVAVDDLEALRIALGYSQFNLYGISYGSRVAQHFLRRYPDATRSVVLDGVVPPQLALGPAIATQAQFTLDSIFARCAEDTACNERYPLLRDGFNILRQRLLDAPAQLTLANPTSGVPEERQFGDEEMAGAIRLLSYHPTTVALLPFLIDQAVEQNYQPFAAQYAMISESMAGVLNIGMHNAVVCTEDAPFFAAEKISRDQLDATYLGPLNFDVLEAMCSVWPPGVMHEGFREPLESDKPVLLLSGEDDPITPPEYGDMAAVRLRNALHRTGKHQGHGQAPRGCVSDIIGDFVESASVEGLNTDCMDRLHAMPFFLGFAGPSP